MNTVRIYIDEYLNASRQQGLKRVLQDIPHVQDVELSEQDPHEIVVDYDAEQNLPVRLIEVLRQQGYHPDILSA